MVRELYLNKSVTKEKKKMKERRQSNFRGAQGKRAFLILFCASFHASFCSLMTVMLLQTQRIVCFQVEILSQINFFYSLLLVVLEASLQFTGMSFPGSSCPVS